MSGKKTRWNPATNQARCSRCMKWKDAGEFVKGRGNQPHSHCKLCNSEWFHERRGTPPNKRRPYAPMIKLSVQEKKRRKDIAQKIYRENNREKIYMWNRLRRMRERGAGSPPSVRLIDNMFCDQDAKCVYCGISLHAGFHIEHKIPVVLGGTNEIDNLQLTCPRCNLNKKTKPHKEYKSILAFKQWESELRESEQKLLELSLKTE